MTPVRIELRGGSARPVQAFHTALAALVAPRLRRAKRSGDYADALAFIGLLKRSVSTIAACVATLQVVAERYRLLRANGNDAEALRKERARALRSLSAAAAAVRRARCGCGEQRRGSRSRGHGGRFV